MTTNETIESRLRADFAGLTKAERHLAAHLMRHYPVAALGSITALAKAAEVSSPTVLRLIHKLGFRGYPEFQAQVHAEVEARLATPLAKQDRWTQGVPDSHILNRFADAVLGNLQATLARIDHGEFDACAARIADPGRQIFVTGGRITHALAAYFVTQMQAARPAVTLVPARADAWPPALLDMKPGDLLIVFDIRRYENSVLQLAEAACAQGVEVALFTDSWMSPVAAHARYRFAVDIEVPSAWDSTMALQLLVETLIADAQTRGWQDTRARLQRLESLYRQSGMFGARG